MRKPLSFLMLSDQPFHKYINHFYPMIIRAFFYHLNNLFLIIHNNPPCHNYRLHYSICPACGKQNRTLVRFHYYTTDISPWQLPNIHMDFCYFVGKLRNRKENYAFANITSDIANFLGLAQLLHLGGINLFRSFFCDLHISAVAFCYIM